MGVVAKGGAAAEVLAMALAGAAATAKAAATVAAHRSPTSDSTRCTYVRLRSTHTRQRRWGCRRHLDASTSSPIRTRPCPTRSLSVFLARSSPRTRVCLFESTTSPSLFSAFSARVQTSSFILRDRVALCVQPPTVLVSASPPIRSGLHASLFRETEQEGTDPGDSPARNYARVALAK